MRKILVFPRFFGNTHVHTRDWTNKYSFNRNCVVSERSSPLVPTNLKSGVTVRCDQIPLRTLEQSKCWRARRQRRHTTASLDVCSHRTVRNGALPGKRDTRALPYRKRSRERDTSKVHRHCFLSERRGHTRTRAPGCSRRSVRCLLQQARTRIDLFGTRTIRTQLSSMIMITSAFL